MENKISYIPLGGVTGVTKNMHLYEYGDKVLIVDAGLGFADETMIGVDLLLPDISYLLKSGKKIVGMVLTHGHEDHIGALPYVLPMLPDFPIYATPLTAALANEKLKEFGVSQRVKPTQFEEELKLEDFQISFIRVTHSVPDTSNIFIKTPVGNFYHGSDFKFDFTPFDDKKTDFTKIVEKSKEGVLSLMSDSLGSERPGFSLSERAISDNILEEMTKTKGKFIFTTYSSNISRLNQAVSAARTLNRRICFVGRSLLKAKDVAQTLGYMKIEQNLEIDLKDIRNYNDKQILLVVAGSQGQEGSALSRIVNGDNKDITINENDVVVFSSDAIPGNEVSVNAVIDEISKAGAKVIYSDISSDFHVSGHGASGDLALMMNLTRPKNVLPIGGTFKHMVAYKNLARKQGFADKNILLPEDGQEVVFTKDGNASYGRKIALKNVYVDQISGEEVDSFVLRDRERIAKDGVVVILIEIDTYGQIVEKPNIVARGFSPTEVNELIKGLGNEIGNTLRTKKTKVKDWGYTRKTIGNVAEKYISHKLRRRPLVLPVVIEV